MKKLLIPLLICLTTLKMEAGLSFPERIEPPCWWTGMQSTDLQLMIYGEQISATDISIGYPGVEIVSVAKVKNPNYLFIDLKISDEAAPGIFDIRFSKNGEIIATHPYELKARDEDSSAREGFSASDVIYLITPDRFVNGDPGNDQVEGMKEAPDRQDRDGRHGGDIQGVINSLDYLRSMGFTAVWLNPVLENNMTKVSYHGYSTTDFYRVDPRYGTNDTYRKLNEELDKRGMKLIMDMIFNHCGSEHWWMDDLPMDDWINSYPAITITSHRRTVNQDPHASETDRKAMTDGWFVPSMPDLNQQNPFMATYLIQNSIWWIETAGLEGIRQDTWPYPDKTLMAQWTEKVLKEYPNFTIVGEEWSLNPAIVSYWQQGQTNHDGYHCTLPSLMDFPLQEAVSRGLIEEETWHTGLITIYEMIANDFLYPAPERLTVFADNHDMSRIYHQLNEDPELTCMALAFFLTVRGVPQIYYGTEILMSHTGDHHGDIRSEFPGGWSNHPINAFTGKGLSDRQKTMQQYLTTIQNWRKTNRAIHDGKMIHFVPEEGIYTFFRCLDKERVMVVLNKNRSEKTLTTDRFREVIGDLTSGWEVISSTEIPDITRIILPARSAMIIELK